MNSLRSGLHAIETRTPLGKLKKRMKTTVTDKKHMNKQFNCRVLLKVALNSTTHEVLFREDLSCAGPMKMRLLINADKRHMLVAVFTIWPYIFADTTQSYNTVCRQSLLKLPK
jgi:hypothetical protein